MIFRLFALLLILMVNGKATESVPAKVTDEKESLTLSSYGAWWGPALGIVRPAIGLGGNFSVVTPNRNIFTLRLFSSGEVFSQNNFDSYAQERAFLFGKILKSDKSTLTGSIGLSQVRGLAHGDYLGMGERCGWFESNCQPEPQYAENHFQTIGIPIEAQWFGHSRFVGFGFSFDADLNVEMPIFGVTLFVPLGYMPF